MKITKAVITAAGPDQRHLPLQSIVNKSGLSKTALELLLDELFVAGIESVAVIVAAGDTRSYEPAVGAHLERVIFIEQAEPLGYGHAVWCARDFVAAESYLLLVSDHLYLSYQDKSCVKQLLDLASCEDCAVSAVQATHESQLPLYGAVGGSRIPQTQDLYEIDKVLEKPTPTLAEQELIVPGLRSAQYLCFFGMHVLTPSSMETLDKCAQSGENFGLTETLQKIARTERYLALEIDGRRFNIAEDYGLMIAQLALALNGPQREEILASLVELLASTRG